MKKSKQIFINCLAMLALVFATSCEDEESVPDGPTMTLSEETLSGKSGQDVETTVDIIVPGGLKNLKITKQINLAADNSFGTNGVETVTPATSGATSYKHTFTYKLSPDEVDKLVSFNFMAEDMNGKTSQKDLTVNTTASGAQIISSYGWKFKSKQNVTSGQPVDDLTECAKDDVYTYNMNGTMGINYGANACTFDGFNEYTGWTLSEDEKVFTQSYRDVFNPAKVTTETYTVTKLTKDEMVLEIFFDLTDFGLSANEKYRYTMQAVPR